MRRTARLFRAAAVAALAGAGGSAVAQHPHHHAGPVPGPIMAPPVGVPCPPPAMTVPCPPVTGPIAGPVAGPMAAPLAGPIGGPSAVDTLTAPPSGVPAVSDSAVASAAPAFGGSRAGAGPGATTAVNPGAYIDGAVPVSQVRIRGDFAYDNNRPDRAEFFYPKCGCFGTPDANGPPLAERNVDYQEVATYFETLLSDRFSAFAEVPVRFINPQVNRNAAGLGDVNFGFKYAAVLTDCRIVTFQLRTVAPTGIGRLGLGAENWRVEPGILWQNAMTDRLIWFGEVRDSIPVDRNSDFAGNVLRYGLGTAYFLYSSPSLRVMPVSELVGWTVLSGREFAPDVGNVSARGDTIVNAKGGVRFGFGEVQYPGTLGRSDLYLGYGRAITGERWYEDIYRVEFRVRY